MIGHEKNAKEIFLRPCSKVLKVLKQLFQIAKTVQNEKLENRVVVWNGLVVLGLATSDSRKLTRKWNLKQVRQRDVSLWYHCDFWPSSLAQEPESHLCPLHCFANVKIPNKIEITKSRSFTSFQMVHTHTHFIYMYSNIIYPEAQTITSLCASIRFLVLSRMFSCHHQSPSCNGSLD